MGLYLVASKLKMKRSKTMIALLLPVIVCVFFLGWIMYWVGGDTKTSKNKSNPEKDNVTIGAIVMEENEEILAQ
jgi:flagellar basal body-associated protein FliL